MTIKSLLNLSQGLWSFNPQELTKWSVIAYNLLHRKEVESPLTKTDAVVKYYDSQLNPVSKDKDGQYNVPRGSVAVVDLIGPLVKYGDWCTYGAEEIVSELWKAERNPNVIGIVMNIDGPGGSVSSVAPFLDFGARKTKPVVGLYDMCCSAHLWAMYGVSDFVMANNTVSATIGSIGVVLSFADNKEYLEKLGYKFHEIYPDESEHKNEVFRLALEGKYDQIKQEMLSPLAIDFQNAVKAARPNLQTKEVGVLTGKTFRTEDAIRLGFTDSVGNMQDAIDMVKVLAEIKK